MKTSCLAIVLLSSIVAGAQPAGIGTQTALPLPTAYSVVEYGGNHRVWERTVYEPGPNGSVIPKKHRYIELATGMNYQSNGRWFESKEKIETFPQGAIARQGQYQVIFANNLNSAGAIDQQTPDGKRLRSNILGLAYDDRSTGQSVLIAQIQDSQGELISDNQVLYTNAFEGVNADVRYSYRKGSFEQDVILRTQLPTPDTFGLNPATTELEVLTEFISPPKETITEHKDRKSGLVDQDVSWGVMRLGRGKAFDLAAAKNSSRLVSVRRQYETVNGRKILLEIVPVQTIQAGLQTLPLQSSITTKLPTLASQTRLIPPTPQAQAEEKPMKLASVKPANKGYVLDYVETDTETDNFTFQGDTTYYVDGPFYIGNTATFEGGTVIKFSDALDDSSDPQCSENSGEGVIQCGAPGTTVCETGPYHPAVFTSMDDNFIGEPITGSSGNPSVINVTYLAVWNPIQYCRFKYAGIGLMECSDYCTVGVGDCQFVNCAVGISGWGTEVDLNNVLVTGTGAGVSLSESDIVVLRNVTMKDVTSSVLFPEFYGGDGGGGPATLAMTNCLLPDLTYLESETPSVGDYLYEANNAQVTDTDFQQVGAGNCYLANGSLYHNAGTVNTDPGVLADLATKTTYPPIVYSNVTISTSTAFSPQAPRDNAGNPDLGYHYDPLDYMFGEVLVSGATMTINPGTVIGVANMGVNENVGIGIEPGAQFLSQGLVTSPVDIVSYDTVQEQSGVSVHWIEPYNGMLCDYWGSPIAINCRFTDWFSMAGTYSPYMYLLNYEAVAFRDCEFHGGYMESDNPSVNLTNCLLERVVAYLFPGDNNTPVIRNCLFWHGTFGYSPWTSTGNAIVADNLFDQTAIPDWMSGATYSGGHNAYVTNCNTLDPIEPGDVILASPLTYQASFFGNYYQPPNSPLINAGSTTADQVGLYHYTTQASQLPETNSIVDIGYHYVATDANGNPLSTLWFGIPDYLADTNGELVAWEMEHFGKIGLDPNASYDGKYNTLLYDYQNSLEPNVVQFNIEATNDYVNTATATVQVNITGGVPYYYAIFATNTTTISWLPFTTTNLTVNLGTTDGVYTVNVGLRGLPANATQTWNDYLITLDRVAPTNTITNPAGITASGVTVIKPYLQLQGFANEQLASLSYDISNATGIFTNQPGYVTDQTFDTNKFDFTTNFFQCFDVPLTNGANALTVRVTDLAGNTSTTNFNLILDYTTATNPPVVNLIWPQDGMIISGDSFTLRGTMSDETGTVVAQIVDENDNTNTVSGIVERNGMFWIENLPLGEGDNIVTVTATDASGQNVTTTTITVSVSDMLLTIDSVPTGADLYQPCGSVSGTVSDANATVTVNNMAATVTANNDGTGSWEADNVPIIGIGTATFDAVASLPEQEMQSRQMQTMDSGSTPATVNASLPVEMTPCVVVTTYHDTKSASGMNSVNGASKSTTGTKDYNANYQANSAGQWLYGYQGTLTNGNTDSGYTESDYEWSSANPGLYYEQFKDSNGNVSNSSNNYGSGDDQYGQITGTMDGDIFELEDCDPDECIPPVFITHYFANNVRWHWIDSSSSVMDVKVDARTTMKLLTGGKAQINRQHLIQLQCGGTEYGRPYVDSWSGCAWLYPWASVQTFPIDTSRMRALGQWVGADGNLWVSLPDNAAMDLKLSAPPRHYYATATPTKYGLTIKASANGTPVDLSTTTPEFCVGQNVTFTLNGLPTGNIVSMVGHWSLPTKYVNEVYQPFELFSPASTVYDINYDLLANTSQTSCWFVNGEGGQVSVGLILTFQNGQTAAVTAAGSFTVYRPSVSHFVNQENGFSKSLSGLNGLMHWLAWLTSKYPGYFGVTQTISCDYANSYYTGGANYLDGDTEIYGEPPPDPPGPKRYDPDDLTTWWTEFRDTPWHPWSPCADMTQVNFTDYIRFQPDGGIFVTIATNGWYMNGHACPIGDIAPNDLPPASNPVNIDIFPSWEWVRHE